jgi:hypothetical protein
MKKKLSFGVVMLAFSMACSGGSSPTAPTPVATPPAPPTAAPPAKVVGLTINASRNAVEVNYTSVLTAIARYDDGSTAPITPTWEITKGPVTLLGNGPVALVTGQAPGTGVITARAEGFSWTHLITVNWPASLQNPRP